MRSNQEIISFIRSLFDQHSNIPLHQPHFGANEQKYLIDCIESTYVSSVGPYVDRLEKDILKYSGTDYGVAVVNGTSGLHVALELVGVKQGDEVLTQALSFIATSNAIHFAGARPVYIDVDYDTMGMSPKSLALFLEKNAEIKNSSCYNRLTGKRITACLPMHTFGFPCRIDELVEICNYWQIPLVEDAAEALGSKYKGRKIGSFGKLAVFSFNGNKIVTSGGGGIIVTNDSILAKKAKHLTTTAKVPHPYEFVHDEVGYNFRMPNINAALLCAQLEQLNQFLQNKRLLANEYNKFFNVKPRYRFETENSSANFWLNCIEFEDLFQRNSFLEEANQSGIMCRPIWTLSYLLPMYKDCQRDEQLNATKLADGIVNIPSSFRQTK